MKFPTSDTHCAKGIFQMQFVLLTLQIKHQGQADHDTTFENS